MSDYDFAFYLSGVSSLKASQIQIELISKIGLILNTDAVDVVILNQNIPTALAYNAIAQGKLLYEVEPFKLMIEPKVLNEYFDYKLSLQKNNLTLVK